MCSVDPVQPQLNSGRKPEPLGTGEVEKVHYDALVRTAVMELQTHLFPQGGRSLKVIVL